MLRRQLRHMGLMFLPQLHSEPVDHVVSVLLVDPLRPASRDGLKLRRNLSDELHTFVLTVPHLADASCFSWSSSSIISLILVHSSELADLSLSPPCFSSWFFFSSAYSLGTAAVSPTALSHQLNSTYR